MATDKPNVRAYLTVQNFEALQEYAKTNKVKSLSNAIDGILSQYFGSTPQHTTVNYPPSIEDRLAALEARVANLEQK